MTTATSRKVLGAGIRAQHLEKHFASVRALRDVSVDFPAGSVTALVGENGAGKSTLLKILGGDYRPDSGELESGGERFAPHSPADAHRAGIRVIAQEPEIIPHVSVAENIYVGALPRNGPFVDRRALHRRIREDLRRFGFVGMLDPATLGENLSPAQRQLVEILRALISGAAVLAFDEPTSSLSDTEVDALFAVIRDLRDAGVAVIYVSHRLAEIFQIADRVVVLRDGQLVGVRGIADITEDQVVRMMVGRDLSALMPHTNRAQRRVVLRVTGLTTDDVADIDLAVHAGEVVAVAGLVGAGRSELARALAGDLPIRAGTVVVDGTRVRLRSPKDAIAAGIAYAPEERKAQALLLHRTVRDNASLAILDRLTTFRFVRRGAERRAVSEYTDRMRVRAPSIEHEVSKLSGGNQQKVVLARWIARKPKVLILDEPTRGIDVGAKAEIYRIIDDLAAGGVAIVVISSELPEVLGLADRVVVMQRGRITGELSRADATEEAVLALAMASDLQGPSQSAGDSP